MTRAGSICLRRNHSRRESPRRLTAIAAIRHPTEPGEADETAMACRRGSRTVVIRRPSSSPGGVVWLDLHSSVTRFDRWNGASSLPHLPVPLSPRRSPPRHSRRPGSNRIGWLLPEAIEDHLAALRDALRALGYVEGRTATFETRFADADLDRLPSLAAELVRSNVDLIIAIARPAILAARQATDTVPIVMAFWGGLGLVAHQVRAGDQSQDCQRARPHDPAIAAAARGRGDPVSNRIELFAARASARAIPSTQPVRERLPRDARTSPSTPNIRPSPRYGARNIPLDRAPPRRQPSGS